MPTTIPQPFGPGGHPFSGGQVDLTLVTPITEGFVRVFATGAVSASAQNEHFLARINRKTTNYVCHTDARYVNLGAPPTGTASDITGILLGSSRNGLVGHFSTDIFISICDGTHKAIVEATTIFSLTNTRGLIRYLSLGFVPLDDDEAIRSVQLGFNSGLIVHGIAAQLV